MDRAADSSDDASGRGRFPAPQPAVGPTLRPEVLDRLSDPDVRVGVITAPAGYGKSTHAAAWGARDDRPVAWIDIEPGHNDAPVLLADLVAALTGITDLQAKGLAARGATPDQFATRIATALGRAVGASTVPFVLVLDDVHLLDDPSVNDLLGALVSHVPAGSTVLLVGRICLVGELARVRVNSTVVEIGVDDLALEVAGVAHILSDMGVVAGEEDLEQVLADTEGWPVGVRLAGLAALADLRHHAAGPPGLSGREASVSDYIQSQWLWGLSDEDREFLMRVSVLDWLSGPLCNAALDRNDAGEVLHRIFSNRLLVVPLDRREGAYRMHGLLREVLAAEFERVDAPAVRQVHQRASAWFDEAGDVDRAVRHALAAGDFGQVEELIVRHTPAYYTMGRYGTISRWIDSVPRDRVLCSPGLCYCAALATHGPGDGAGLAGWLRLGDNALESSSRSGPESDSDRMIRLLQSLLRSTTMMNGPVRPALEQAATAYEGLPSGIWHAAACLAYGVWSWTVGDTAAGVKLLTEGAHESAVLGAATMEANCSALLAMIAHAEGDLVRARSLSAHARQLVVDHGLEGAPALVVVTASYALSSASAGEVEVARAIWLLAREQLTHYRDVFGWGNVQSRIALAHTSLLLGDRIGSETLLREAHDILVTQPDAVRAHRQIAELEDKSRQLARNSTFGASSITTAELRVLHYLPTNLSLAEIGGRLYVSRYTIKTHCASIYRKLGVTSRSAAVESARRLGLLEAASLSDLR